MSIDSAIGHTKSVAHQQNCLECIEMEKEKVWYPLTLESLKRTAEKLEQLETESYIREMDTLTAKAWYNRPRNPEFYPI